MSKQLFSQIHHIAIICSDYPRSKHFYTQILGFEIISENYRQTTNSYKLDLRVNEFIQIELFWFNDAPKRPSYPEAQGLRHLAFAVNDLHEVINHLKTYDIVCEPIRVDQFAGKQFTFFSDPDDLPLELYQI